MPIASPLTRMNGLTGGIALAVLMCALFWQCNTREPGCLDVDAVNFDFSAEKSAPEECIYPDLLLNILYRWADTTFNPGQIYTNELGQDLIIESFYLLLSQFAWTDVEGAPRMINDQIDWYLKNGAPALLEVSDDFTLVDRSSFNYRLGEIRNSGLQERLRFTLGVPDTLTPVCLDSLPEQHALRSARVAYNADPGVFAQARFVINRDTALQTLDTFHVFGNPRGYDFILDKAFVQGRDDTVRLAVNLFEIFRSIDLEQDLATIAAQAADVVDLAVTNNN